MWVDQAVGNLAAGGCIDFSILTPYSNWIITPLKRAVVFGSSLLFIIILFYILK